MGVSKDKKPANSLFTPFMEKQGFLILDGGLATELERSGYDLNDHLWSARLLDSDHKAIADVHRSYLNAGADCIISASYQASIPGFREAGYSKKEAITLLENSVKIACDVRDEFVNNLGDREGDRIAPLVAASIGPYGAYLADGSEYRGQYTIPVEDLSKFHEERLSILAKTSADILSCETIPSYKEAEVLHNLILNYPDNFFWVSFSCQNSQQISDGTPLGEVVLLFEDIPQVLAIGVNCTSSRYILDLIKNIQSTDSQKEIIVYPNSGEIYVARTKRWAVESDPTDFALLAQEWLNIGARLIGGCCRTMPDHIRQLRWNLHTNIEKEGKNDGQK